MTVQGMLAMKSLKAFQDEAERWGWVPVLAKGKRASVWFALYFLANKAA